jgi:hypothetical protein
MSHAFLGTSALLATPDGDPHHRLPLMMLRAGPSRNCRLTRFFATLRGIESTSIRKAYLNSVFALTAKGDEVTMNQSRLVKSVIATAALLMISPNARADAIRGGVPWGYSAASTQIFSDTPQQTSSIIFTGSTDVANETSTVTIYKTTISSSAAASAPDSFVNTPFNLEIALTDFEAAGSFSADALKSATVDFAGTFSASNVTSSSVLLVPMTFLTSPQTIVLGSSDTGWRDYQVSIASFTPPGTPGGVPGTIDATVTVGPGSDPTSVDVKGQGSGPATTPEPSSLLLAALALPAYALRKNCYLR